VVARIKKLDQRMTRQHVHDHGHELLAINGKDNPGASYFHPNKDKKSSK
jgi:hypothetical protein